MGDRRVSRWTIERKIRLLEAIMVCIVEHPIVGQWITEIPTSSEKPNNCETCRNWDTVNDHCYFIQECRYEPKTEPQKCYLRESCDHYGDKQVCGRCREYNLYSHTKTEPQTSGTPYKIGTSSVCKDEPQIDWHYSKQDGLWYPYKHEDEPQTDCLE